MTVWYHSQPVGEVQPNGRGGFAFAYNEEWINGGGTFPISISLPLGPVVDQERADAWFSNLIPEGPARERLCQQLGISPDNRFEILTAIGRDCAGALVIGDKPVDEEPPRHHAFRTGELRDLVRYRPALPVLSDGRHVRFSLAGSASKWAVVVRDGEFQWPRGSAPSTHILKVYDPRFSYASYNEAFTALIAARLGPPIVTATPNDDYLLIERYDRKQVNGATIRLHQEDAAQALGVPAFRKYQREGGVGIRDVIDVIRAHSSSPLQDQRSLITWQLSNLILGNSDGHLKNVSFLYDEKRVRLAPFYDMVCTSSYDAPRRCCAVDRKQIRCGGMQAALSSTLVRIPWCLFNMQLWAIPIVGFCYHLYAGQKASNEGFGIRLIRGLPRRKRFPKAVSTGHGSW